MKSIRRINYLVTKNMNYWDKNVDIKFVGFNLVNMKIGRAKKYSYSLITGKGIRASAIRKILLRVRNPKNTTLCSVGGWVFVVIRGGV